jgi:hypothetical protein
MSVKIAVGNIVEVPLKFTFRDGAVDRLFSLTLTATRKTQEEIEEDPDLSVKDFLLNNVTDWGNQRFVLLDNNEPAPYSRENFEFLLKQPGLLGTVWQAYQKAVASKEKN